MAGQEVARGEIVIEVNDREALANLRRIDDQFNRTMRDIEREEATVDLNADVDQLKRDLRQAEREVKKYNSEVEGEENKMAQANKRRRLTRLQAIADEKRADLAAAQARIKAHQEEGRALKNTERRIDAISKREIARSREFEAAERRRQAAMKQTARVSSSLNQQRIRELKESERQAHAMDLARDRELASIPKLQRGYAELENRLQKLAIARRKARGDEQAVTLVRLRERETVDQMGRLMRRLRSLGHEPISIHVQLERGARLGRTVRDAFRDRNVISGAAVAGAAIGRAAGLGVNDGLRRTLRPSALGNIGLRGLNRFRGVLEGLSNMTVRLGPFTATLRQVMVAMSLFGPTIVDLVGALGSLVSVTGAATLGLGALGAAVVGGGLPALIGMVTVIKPMVTQFKDLVTISKAYNKAVLQYGKGSDQAQAKLQQMNHALRGSSEDTRKAFVAAGTLADRWKDLTSPARASAFNIMGRGINFLSDNLGFFAKRTNRTFDVAEQSLGRWMDGLESAEGKDLLGRMMDNFNDALGPALDGLGNLAAYLGRVGAAASTHLPVLSRQFEHWSEDVLHSSDNAADLQRRVDSVVGSLRTLGHFVMSTGRFLKTFFAGGVGAGENFLDTMSNALDRWNRTLQTTSGQAGLQDFFSRSVSGAEALYAAVAPLVTVFVQWASALSPVVASFFRGVGAITSFVHSILELTGLQGPVSALAATLGALWAVNRIGAATAAIANFTGALLGMTAASEGVAVATAGVAASQRFVATSTATSTAAMAAQGAGAGAAAGKVGTLRAAATKVIPAIAGMGAVAGGVATAGVAAVAGAAVYGAYKFATMKLRGEELQDQMNGLNDRARAAGDAFKVTGNALADTGSAAAHANMNLKAARGRLHDAKRGTDEYRAALLDYRDALRYAEQAQQAWTTTSRNYSRAAEVQNNTDKKRAELAKEITKLEKEQEANARHGPGGRSGAFVRPGALEEQRKKLAAVRAEYERLTAISERASNVQAAAPLNIARGYRGLLPVIGAAEQSLGRLARQSRSVATKIAIKFDAPKDVGRVASQASRALKAGVPQRIVTRIVVNSRDAEQALRRLSRYTIDSKEVRILQRGGQQAIAMIERIIGRRLNPKEQKIAERGGNQVVTMLEKIIRRRIGDKSFSINARDNASGVIGSVIGQLNSIDGRVANSYIYTHYRSTGNRPGMQRAGGGDRAVAQPAAARASIVREQRRADAGRTPMLSRSATARGRKVTQPTLLTGEERRTEFVIATNPRYRKSNLRYWQMAGQALGATSAATGYLPYGSGTINQNNTYTPLGGSLQRPAKMPRRKKRLKKLGAKRRTKLGRKWAHYVSGLKVQRDDWEREVGIRESQVREPSDFIMEQGRIMVNGEDLGPKMVVNQAAIDTYTKDLSNVENAYNTLLSILNQLVNAIPNALYAFSVEKRDRQRNIGSYKDQMRRSQRVMNDDKASKDAKDRAKKRFNAAQRGLNKEQGIVQDINSDTGTLREDAKDAGFDIREQTISRDEVRAERTGVQGRSEGEAKERNTGTTGGGAGGGGTSGTPLSYGAQSALADTEKANALREFGSNFAAVGGALSGAGTAGSTSGTLSALGTNPVFAAGAVAGATLAGAGDTLSSGTTTSGTTALRSLTDSTSATQTATAAPSSGDTSISVVNNYDVPPEDPHTWSKGIEFELAAAMG